MIFPDERIPEVCRIGPVEAAKLLDKARSGDFDALADWTVRSVFLKLLHEGIPRTEALRKTRDIMSGVSLQVAFTNG